MDFPHPNPYVQPHIKPTGTLVILWTRDNTLNLSSLNLEHVIHKQLQININYTFRFMFLLHVLILKAEKQLFPPYKPLFVILIQVIVIFNFIYNC
jgi:hypothetical protein